MQVIGIKKKKPRYKIEKILLLFCNTFLIFNSKYHNYIEIILYKYNCIQLCKYLMNDTNI